MNRKIEIYDTTLRDGAQMRGISFSVEDKLRITEALDRFGIDFIEAGWPGSNNTDTQFFKEVLSLRLRKAVIVAFSMTCRKGLVPKEDPNLQKLLEAKTEIITLVGKSWRLHVEEVLHTTLAENLLLIERSCAFFQENGRQVFYDAEHFFNGYTEDFSYALQTLKAAIKGGAERIILCDTNGGTLSSEIGKIVGEVKKEINIPLGIHTHNDMGLAVANAIRAVECGVIQVQGTINGYGERCGNADLCSIVPILQLEMGIECLEPEQLKGITELSHYTAEIVNLGHDPQQPYVGANAFTHKGGMHGDAQNKCPESYQHINPALVGNLSHTVVSELSGKGNILTKAKEFGIVLTTKQIEEVLIQIKRFESNGFQFEGADASVELLMRKIQSGYSSPFEVLNISVMTRNRLGKSLSSEAIVKLKVRDEVVHVVDEGNGPVNALDRALRKGLLDFFPALKKTHLTDYKVRVLGERGGTGVMVRVLIDSSDGNKIWTTVGCSENIIEASLHSLVESLEYTILKSSF